MRVLVLNAGSSSVKYRLIDLHAPSAAAGSGVTPSDEGGIAGKIERIGKGVTHEQAFAEILSRLPSGAVEAVGHRVVHGGQDFHDATIIDDRVEAAIEACSPLAPLHNPPNLAGIRAARKALPDVPQVAVFDTAFHARLPRRARTYALDQDLAEREGIRRYGFHGTSHAFVAQLAAKHLGRQLSELRLVTLHLGNGASACAVELGHSTETSMGMTPLEGLVMGTRPGDLDPGVVLHLLRKGRTLDEVDHLLSHESGLAGLSGLGNDLRDIEDQAAKGHDRARLAIQVFAHRARKAIGAYAAVMGGLDAVVLTGGIGENGASMRQRILSRFDWLGLVLDDERNVDAKVTVRDPVACITSDVSRVAALVVRTDEERAIAEQTCAIVRAATIGAPKPIPIAVSARHLHLTKESFRALFGDGEPTKLRDISQPGQYACQETVDLVGPRGRIDKVRLLGPLRPKDQVEISRTDEFKLGIDAPIRDSGKVEGSAGITLEGPNGKLTLSQGLICAKRHIHMHPDDAERYGVKDGDEVEVALSGGERDLTFGDVLIRVSSKFVLEMHIDTDEANAAELNQGAQGDLVYTGIDGQGAHLRAKRTV